MTVVQPPLELCDRCNAALRQLKALRRKDMMNDVDSCPYSMEFEMHFGSVRNRVIAQHKTLKKRSTIQRLGLGA